MGYFHLYWWFLSFNPRLPPQYSTLSVNTTAARRGKTGHKNSTPVKATLYIYDIGSQRSRKGANFYLSQIHTFERFCFSFEIITIIRSLLFPPWKLITHIKRSNLKQDYLELHPVLVSGFYFQETVFQITTLLSWMKDRMNSIKQFTSNIC